jgi:hypothetical protein
LLPEAMLRLPEEQPRVDVLVDEPTFIAHSRRTSIR